MVFANINACVSWYILFFNKKSHKNASIWLSNCMALVVIGKKIPLSANMVFSDGIWDFSLGKLD